MTDIATISVEAPPMTPNESEAAMPISAEEIAEVPIWFVRMANGRPWFGDGTSGYVWSDETGAKRSLLIFGNYYPALKGAAVEKSDLAALLRAASERDAAVREVEKVRQAREVDRDEAVCCGDCQSVIWPDEARYVCRDAEIEYCADCAVTWGEDLACAEQDVADGGGEYEIERLASLKARLASGEIKAEDKAVWHISRSALASAAQGGAKA